MGNCAYRLSLYIERAPATRRIRAGGDTAGWNEPLRVGFWRGPGNGSEADNTAKEEKLIAKSGIARDDQGPANPAASEGAARSRERITSPTSTAVEVMS